MTFARPIQFVPSDEVLSREVADLPGCVGCTDCDGLCHALMEALSLPDVILRRPTTASPPLRVIDGGGDRTCRR